MISWFAIQNVSAINKTKRRTADAVRVAEHVQSILFTDYSMLIESGHGNRNLTAVAVQVEANPQNRLSDQLHIRKRKCC